MRVLPIIVRLYHAYKQIVTGNVYRLRRQRLPLVVPVWIYRQLNRPTNFRCPRTPSIVASSGMTHNSPRVDGFASEISKQIERIGVGVVNDASHKLEIVRPWPGLRMVPIIAWFSLRIPS